MKYTIKWSRNYSVVQSRSENPTGGRCKVVVERFGDPRARTRPKAGVGEGSAVCRSGCPGSKSVYAASRLEKSLRGNPAESSANYLDLTHSSRRQIWFFLFVFRVKLSGFQSSRAFSFPFLLLSPGDRLRERPFAASGVALDSPSRPLPSAVVISWSWQVLLAPHIVHYTEIELLMYFHFILRV